MGLDLHMQPAPGRACFSVGAGSHVHSGHKICTDQALGGQALWGEGWVELKNLLVQIAVSSDSGEHVRFEGCSVISKDGKR